MKNEIYDKNTGEVVETKKYKDLPNFVLTFTKDLGLFQNLTKHEILLTFEFLKVVNTNNEIMVTQGLKERISKNLNLAINSINPMISNLKKKKILAQKEDENGKILERGNYLLNPRIFGKGKWEHIKKIRMEIEWNFLDFTKKIKYNQENLNPSEILDLEIKEQQKKLQELKEQQFTLIHKEQEEKNAK